MKIPILLLAIICTAVSSFAQKIDLITLSGYGATAAFYYETADKISIVFTKDGAISEFGTQYDKGTYGYYPGKLLKYMGRVDYYSKDENEAFMGKVKYIGLTMIPYYGSYDDAALQGKIKSIGSTQFEYYLSFEDASIKGTIKNVGSTAFTYCSSFDNEATRGRIKSIGNTRFDWYTSFDDKSLSGKLKSIDNYTFTYYTSFENNNGQKGFMKSGFQSKYINGINYYVRN
ncbi:MAG: leucine-rich repeat protein [Chitinophagaceae bacterium]|nr:leucine-rich repeat protein [Chitinophagaceae bacterium]